MARYRLNKSYWLGGVHHEAGKVVDWDGPAPKHAIALDQPEQSEPKKAARKKSARRRKK